MKSHLNPPFDNSESKDIQLCGNDYRVLNLLQQGEYTAFELSSILNLPDPRSNIRYLRNYGYNIADYWINTEYARCKKYFFKSVCDD